MTLRLALIQKVGASMREAHVSEPASVCRFKNTTSTRGLRREKGTEGDTKRKSDNRSSCVEKKATLPTDERRVK